MFMQLNIVFVTLSFLILSLPLRSVADSSVDRFARAKAIAEETCNAFIDMIKMCINSNIPNQKFKIDNIKGFINYPSRTTVGSAPKVTSNRKFFANIVSATAFNDMLNNDVDVIRMNLIKKLHYCDDKVMTFAILKDFYDREVDQTKL